MRLLAAATVFGCGALTWHLMAVEYSWPTYADVFVGAILFFFSALSLFMAFDVARREPIE